MPKIISYTPPWLSRPSPGSQAFISIQNHDSTPSKRPSHLSSPSHEVVDQPYYGPHRLLARRGTEIFVVIGNQIRWTDLGMIKNNWEEQTYHAGSRSKLLEHQHEGQLPTYRVCQNDCSVPGIRLTWTGIGCTHLSTNTAIDNLSFRQFSGYLDGTYNTCCYFTRRFAFISWGWVSIEAQSTPAGAYYTCNTPVAACFRSVAPTGLQYCLLRLPGDYHSRSCRQGLGA